MYKKVKQDMQWHFCQTKRLIMKITLTSFFCAALCLHISARATAQNVTLKSERITIKDAFREINKQTGYAYFWSSQRVKSNTVVSVDIKNQPIESAITAVLKSLPLSYTLDGKLILIKENPNSGKNQEVSKIESRALESVVKAQEGMNIQGLVVDAQNQPLVGATIKIYSKASKLLKEGASRNNGTFTMNEVPTDGYLTISLIGYKEVRMAVQTNLGSIVLNTQEENLEEFVVVGYMSKRTSDVTGAVQSIKGDELRKSVSTPNVLSMLKGKTTGLYITESNGESGSKGQVVERGQSSMVTPTNNYLGPLIVVDGVITNYSSLQDAVNPADVESINILKDASSTAIYGSRAAQGVIAVQTKRGAAGQSTVDIRSQYGSIAPVRDLRFMSTPELINFMDTQMKRYWEQTPSIQASFPNVDDFIAERRVYSDADQDRNFNWEDAIYSKGNFRNIEAGISHGTAKTKFYAGLSWFKENGALYDNSFDRKSVRVNIDHAVSSKFHTSFSISSMIDRTQKRNGIPELYMIQPFMHPYDDAGNLQDSLPVRQSSNYGPVFTSWAQNFLGETQYDNTRLTDVQNHLGNIQLKYDILQGLSIQSRNSINYMGTSVNSYLDPRSFSGKYGGFPYLFSSSSPELPNGTLDILETKYVDYLTSNMLSYNKQINKHFVNAIIGQEWGKRTTEGMDINYNTLLPNERNAGAAKKFGDAIAVAYGDPYLPKGRYQERATFSVFGQADYNYSGKYLASASVRTDATTNFGRDKRYGTFYALSGGWLLSQEDFLKDNSLINMLKLRAAYGTSGRDLGDGYLNTTFYTENMRYEELNNVGSRITQLANPTISWETLYNTNVGIDAQLFNRLGVNLDLYHKRSDGLLQNVTLPSAQGSLTQYQNIGQIVNKGIEIMLNAHIIKSKDFNWHSNFNISFNKNSITKLYQDSLIDSYSRSYYRKIGEDINVIKAIEFAGINAANGNMQHYNYDATGNQVVVEGIGNVNELQNWVTVGSATPKFFGGFSNTFQYKEFTLNAEWWFQYGNYQMMSLVNNFQSPTAPRLGRNNVVFGDNQHIWQQEGDTKANYPDVFSTNPNAWQALTYRSSKLWGNGSHARLRNVRFSYTLPKSVLNQLKIARADLYVSGDNLLVIKHKDFVGADPEGAALGGSTYFGVGTGFANPRRLLLGIQLSF